MKKAVVVGVALFVIFGICEIHPKGSERDQKTERMGLVDEIKKFEEEIGFRPTKNFLNYSEEKYGYPLCYLAPMDRLPYNYLDLGLSELKKEQNESDCLAISKSPNKDAFFYLPEALARIGTPMTPSLMRAEFERFVFVIFHEDYHEQVKNLPAGVEEAAGTLIGLKAAQEFTSRKFGKKSRKYHSMIDLENRYSTRFRDVASAYAKLQVLYARLDSGAITAEKLQHERGRIFTKLGGNSPNNNASLAWEMTYVRRYSVAEEIFRAEGGSVRNTIQFFASVDEELGPFKSQATDDASIQSYEERTMELIRELLDKVEAGNQFVPAM